MMKVAILGGTGFVGTHLTEALLAHQHTPRLLVRPGSEDKLNNIDACEHVSGDVADEASIRELLQDVDVVIYNIGILREFPSQGITFQALQFDGVKRTADIAASFGVRRFILMSANGVEQSLTTYQRTKLAAEAHIQGLDLDWTIFRPSVIFGDPQGHFEFASMLKQQIVDPPLPIPLFYKGILPTNPGGFALSPVHVDDVATVFVKALDLPETIGSIYTLGGTQDLTWKQILSKICDVSGKQKLMLPVPVVGPVMAASLLDRFPWFPISRDQIRMLLAGNTCRGDEIFDACGITPKDFDAENLSYLNASSKSMDVGRQTLRES